MPKAQRDAHTPLIAINSPNVSLSQVLKLRKRSVIQNPYQPPIGLHFFRGKQMPVAAAKRLRKLFQEGLVVDRLAVDDFVEVIVQTDSLIITAVPLCPDTDSFTHSS